MDQSNPTVPPPAALEASSVIADGRDLNQQHFSARSTAPNNSTYPNNYVKSAHAPAPALGKRAILIDTQNAWRGAAERGGRPHYAHIRDTLAAGRPWIGVAVLSEPPGCCIDGIRGALRRTGFATRTWRPVAICGGQFKTDADPAVVLAGAKLLWHADVSELVVVSGDSDLRVLFHEAHELGKRVITARYRWQRAFVLDSLADEIVLLDEQHLLPMNA